MNTINFELFFKDALYKKNFSNTGNVYFILWSKKIIQNIDFQSIAKHYIEIIYIGKTSDGNFFKRISKHRFSFMGNKKSVTTPKEKFESWVKQNKPLLKDLYIVSYSNSDKETEIKKYSQANNEKLPCCNKRIR